MVRLGLWAPGQKTCEVDSHCIKSGHCHHSDRGDAAKVLFLRCLPWEVGLFPSLHCALPRCFPGKEVTSHPHESAGVIAHLLRGKFHKARGIYGAFVWSSPCASKFNHWARSIWLVGACCYFGFSSDIMSFTLLLTLFQLWPWGLYHLAPSYGLWHPSQWVVFRGIPYFLAKDAPGPSCLFPVPALESAISTSSLGSFCWEWY